MREVFIITEEGKHIYYRIPNIPEDASKEETNNPKYSHAFYLEDYMEKNNIDVDAKNKTSYGLAEELMKKGLSPIIVENREMFIFVPPQITKLQYTWYKGMYPALKRFNIHYAYLENNEMMNIDPELDEPKNQNLKRFYKNIEKNLKSQKESENNEYRPNI